MEFNQNLVNKIELFLKSLNEIFLTLIKTIKPNKRRIIADEKPILWLLVIKVTVATKSGPIKEVNFPDRANKPKPAA